MMTEAKKTRGYTFSSISYLIKNSRVRDGGEMGRRKNNYYSWHILYVLYKLTLVDTGTKRNAYSALISQAEKVVHVQVNIHTCCAWLHV